MPPATDMTARSGVPVSLRGVSKHYNDFVGVDKLDLDIEAGELIALLGPSGCGKTTTLRMVAGLISVTEGEINVGGRDITRMPTCERDMGIVFQNYALFPHMTIAQNVAFGLEMRGVPKAEIAPRVEAALAMVHLEGRGHRKPAQLSGGQQQRVALARALVVRPSVLLMDEPLSNLDAKLRDEMRREIRDIQKKTGITAIFVTHDQSEALAMCDRVAVMKAGYLMQLGTPTEIYETPRNPFVASFVGRVNTLTGKGAGDGSYLIGDSRILSERRLSGPVTIMVRPHRIHVLDGTGSTVNAENRVTGTVTAVTYVGDMQQIEVQCGGFGLTVECATLSSRRLPKTGGVVTLGWSAIDTMVFDESAEQ